MEINPVIQVRGRPGYFAALTEDAAQKITNGHMVLYWDADGSIMVETITRARKSLRAFDAHYRVVFFAIDENGHMVTRQV